MFKDINFVFDKSYFVVEKNAIIFLIIFVIVIILITLLLVMKEVKKL